MTIQILGSGCPTCKKLYELTKQAAQELGCTDTVEYSTDIAKLVEMGVMTSPVLAINNKPALVGFVPDIEKIKEVLRKQRDGAGEQSTKSGCSCGGKC